jgi:hypothetical protein
LFLSRVYTGWVMGASVKEEGGTVRGGGEGAKKLVASEADSLGIVILVGERFNPNILEDSEVVRYEYRASDMLDVR